MSSRFQAGGPAQYNHVCKLSRKLFVDKFNFYLVGYPGTCYNYSWILALDTALGLLPGILK